MSEPETQRATVERQIAENSLVVMHGERTTGREGDTFFVSVEVEGLGHNPANVTEHGESTSEFIKRALAARLATETGQQTPQAALATGRALYQEMQSNPARAEVALAWAVGVVLAKKAGVDISEKLAVDPYYLQALSVFVIVNQLRDPAERAARAVVADRMVSLDTEYRQAPLPPDGDMDMPEMPPQLSGEGVGQV